MKGIKSINGEILMNEDEIKDRWMKYFQEMYESEEIVSEESAEVLSEINTNDGDGVNEISLDEIKCAMKQMKNGKAVGCDNVAAEYILTGGPLVVSWLQAPFNQCLKEGHTPVEWKRAVAMPLYKGIWQPLNTICGSFPYAAPKLFCDENYFGQLVNVWALGILLYFMVTGTMPFRAHSVAALKNFVLEGKYQIPGYVSDPCCYIIEHTLVQAPKQRLTIDEILDSEWFKVSPPPVPDPSKRRKNSLLELATRFRRGSTPLSPNNNITDEQLTARNNFRKCSTTLPDDALKNFRNRQKVNVANNNTTQNTNSIISEEKDTNIETIPPKIRKKLANTSKGQSFDVQMLPSSKPAENIKCADGTPAEQGKFIMLPTCTHDLTFLNPLEVKTREKLKNYCISSKMLCDSIGQNSKSSIIGIYRVVMHRVLTEEYIWDSLSDPNNFIGKKHPENIKKTKSDKSTLRQKISRTCVIL